MMTATERIPRRLRRRSPIPLPLVLLLVVLLSITSASSEPLALNRVEAINTWLTNAELCRSTYSKRPLSLLTCLANISCKVLGPIGGQQACAQITYILYRVLNKIGVLFGSS